MPEEPIDDLAIKEYMQHFLQEHTSSLKKILCTYVLRMGLARGENVRVVADEAFQDAMLVALAQGQRLMQMEQPRSWFLAVAANILKRKRASFARRYRFEVLVSDLASSASSSTLSEAELLEQVTSSSFPGPEQTFEAREHVRELLGLVSPEDGQILTLALLHELDTQGLARELGVSAGAARVRLHRALQRLRKAWNEREEASRRDGSGRYA
ncbi:MAG TPA: sigma-70 family RNA polymerase sigma factor [Ktedonobacteraceae bacterium]